MNPWKLSGQLTDTGLLSGQHINKYMKSIYVAASSQHVGKTTSTLGLVKAFMQKGYKVGYCKPVGQKYLDVKDLRVDKDTLLFADLIHFELDPDLHSPIILGKGATTMLLDHPNKYDLNAKIMNAARKLEANNDFVIYEGTVQSNILHKTSSIFTLILLFS